MRLAVGILTRNQFVNGRHEVFTATLRSLTASHEDIDLYVVDNGSTDETADYVRGLGGTCIADPIHTHGHGANVTIGICAASGADVVVFSNDDVGWHSGALEAVRELWEAAPPDLGIIGGLLEDCYPWNAISGTIDLAGRRGLVRDTVPAAAWTFRAATWADMKPLPESAGWDDVPTCHRLNRKGYRLAQFDLAAHLGEGLSTWGNDSARHGTPLDRAAWGLP